MRLALGTVQFGLNYGIANERGQVDLAEARSIVEYASEYGIDTLDTAIAYGDGEQRLGQIGVQDWQIVSKLPALPAGCSDIQKWVTDTLGKSLQRLKVKSLYGLLLHRPQQLLEQNGDQLYRSLQQLKNDGLVQKIGVSIYNPAELDTLCSHYDLDLVQAPFNIFDRRLIDSCWLPRLSKQGIELHIRSVFLQGLLLMKPNERPKKFDRWASVWSSYDAWIKQSGLMRLQACLRYSLSFPEISKIIIGVDSQKQIKEIVQAAKGPVPPIPDTFITDDPDLINPGCWSALS